MDRKSVIVITICIQLALVIKTECMSGEYDMAQYGDGRAV